MDLVDTHGFEMRGFGAARFHPSDICVAPSEPVKVENERGGGYSVLAKKGPRIAFFDNGPVALPDLKFVVCTFVDRWQKNLPDTVAIFSHGVAASVPCVEIADDADALSVGSPDAKSDACDAFDCGEMGAEFSVKFPVFAAVHLVEVRGAE